MKTREQMNEQGLALTRAVSTATLGQSFQHTDELLEQAGLDADQREQLTTARGWIMTVLEERGQLAAIGVTADYEPISDETLDQLERAGVQPARIAAMRATRDETEARFTITGASGIEVYADDAAGAALAARTIVETDGETSAEIHDDRGRWIGRGETNQHGYILKTTQGRRF